MGRFSTNLPAIAAAARAAAAAHESNVTDPAQPVPAEREEYPGVNPEPTEGSPTGILTLLDSDELKNWIRGNPRSGRQGGGGI